jgi:sugar lactone lactonase YvrE
VLWSHEGIGDFEKGKPEGVAVTARGGLVLARAIREVEVKALQESSQPFLWSLAVDSKQNLFVGSGNDGRVFRVPRTGSAGLFFSSGDLAVQAIAVDGRDSVYAGTSPDGKVYRLDPEGKSEVWFDPDERYIWAMALDRSGHLYVATGEKGIIYKVTGRGSGTPFFDSEESHIVALGFDRAGNLLAGSSGKGLLYRIAPDGKATVLLDTDLKEVNALAVDGSGSIYASAIQADAGPAARPGTGPERERRETAEPVATPEPIPAPATERIRVEAPEDGEPGVAPAPQRVVKSQVYRIDPDGIATPLWSSETETVFSMALGSQREVYLGTGDTGKIRRLEANGGSSLAAKVSSSQVTALLTGSDGALHVAASNSGKVYRLDAEVADTGSYLSLPRDTSTVSRWGRIAWSGRTPAGTKVELFTRSGNSAVPDATWSDWSPAYVAPSGSGVVSPTARFIQWRARLSRQSKGVTPLLESVVLTYLPANLPPRVRDVRVNPPGVVILKPPVVPEPDRPPTAFSTPPKPPEGAEFASPFPEVPGKSVYQRGMRSVVWDASDPNGDELRFELLFRGDGEEGWKTLARGLSERYFAWDSTQMPDGRYRIQVRATDAPSNPPGGEKTGEELSDSFLVDNTPPRVEAALQKDDKGAVVDARVTDATSPVKSLEVSIDAERWSLVMPVDGIPDSTTEQYRIPIDRLSPGEHVLILKATDVEGNVGAEKVIVRGG